MKHSYLLKNPDDVGRGVQGSFLYRRYGQTRPCADRCANGRSEDDGGFSNIPKKCEIRSYKPTGKGNALQVKRVTEALRTAEKPLICIGGGVFASNAQNEVVELSKKLNIPVITTMMGISVFADEDPLYVGMIGTHGTKLANYAVNACDTLFLVGARVGGPCCQNAPGTGKRYQDTPT